MRHVKIFYKHIDYFFNNNHITSIMAGALLILLITFAVTVSASEYYVAPNGSSSFPGTREAPWSLNKANNSLKPGDTAILVDGDYTGTPIAPIRSGQAENYITYRAENKHGAVFHDITELPESRGPVAIYVSGKAYIEVDGIRVRDVKRWVMGVKSHHITITNGHFENSTGWINCRFEENGDGIRIINNYFQEGTDLVSLDGGDGHYVEGNYFGDATHTGLVLLGVQRSVVRKNFMTNRRWRCMEVESQRHEPYRHSKYNLIEKNIFDYSPCKSIQYAGNYSILRRNIFRRSLDGMGWANYLGSAKTPEAWHDEHNRFYNNVITECGTNDIVLQLIEENNAKGIPVEESVSDAGYGMSYTTNLFNPPIPEYSDCAYGDNVVVNNIFYLNANTTNLSDKKGKKASPTTQVAFDWNATPEFGRFYYNNFFSGDPGADVFYFADAPYMNPPVPRNQSVVIFEQTYPEWASNNMEVDPKFIDPAQTDYHLQADSPCIDQGGPLTRAAAAGQGTQLEVQDALYFTDGYGLLEPDIIRVDTSCVKITGIDYETNTLTLEQEMSWQKDTPVYLDYRGSGPDLGAFEYGDTETGINPLNGSGKPDFFNLYENYPNPFNPETCIRYELSEPGHITLFVYNIMGQKIRTLCDHFQESGLHQVIWDGKDDRGNILSSGIYYYQLKKDEYKNMKKMMLIR
ncbi:right-handed parallel beta-helix repeat-containing protein [candidate division KSB1 bacterium]|nr:right-handed parallel beta-helix repeat-containing protein [candidate division KSB1 bacterium]